jgi:hypothetical protein
MPRLLLPQSGRPSTVGYCTSVDGRITPRGPLDVKLPGISGTSLPVVAAPAYLWPDR